MAKIYYSLTMLFLAGQLHAASCCGGGQSAASVMIADHIQEWTLSSALRSDIGQTNSEGQALMDSDQNKDQTLTYSIEYKRLFQERFQGNINISFVQKESKRLGRNESNSGMGDLSLGGFYEAITNYNYHAWAPRLFVGIKAIAPFGENNFNSKKSLRTDIRGTGFYKIDLPLVMVKGDFKVSLTPQYLPSQKYLDSTYAFSSAGTYTYAINDEFDLSGTLQWNYLAKKEFSSQILVPGNYWDVTVAPSWMVKDNLSIYLSYTDSTLIGTSRNSALYRSVALGMTWSELL